MFVTSTRLKAAGTLYDKSFVVLTASRRPALGSPNREKVLSPGM
ncbi:hypothetical protein AVDCRST_MAG92-2708 [uncultured Coleofasciculus sp.]|uniref:Uncharacterized protein n=1 Tax=uncultured Coleofasciculus sp. TaxID=1267456 RepID=A0A6J4IZ44_9CYAN|nr:hypothetical protein AVDCRST_MAG92-2708 [uncultured Coleofasciculus sp.]